MKGMLSMFDKPWVDTPEWSYLKQYTPTTVNTPLITLTSKLNTAYKHIDIDLTQVNYKDPQVLYCVSCIRNDNNALVLPVIGYGAKVIRLASVATGFTILFAMPIQVGQTVKSIYTIDEYKLLPSKSNLLVIKSEAGVLHTQSDSPSLPVNLDSYLNRSSDLRDKTSVSTKTQESTGAIKSSVMDLVKSLQSIFSVLKGSHDTNVSLVSGTKPIYADLIEQYNNSLNAISKQVSSVLDSASEQLSNAVVKRTNSHIEDDCRSTTLNAGAYIQQRAPLIQQTSQSHIISSYTESHTCDYSDRKYKTIVIQADNSLTFSKASAFYTQDKQAVYATEYILESASSVFISDGVYVEAKNKLRGDEAYATDNNFVVEAGLLSSVSGSVSQLIADSAEVVCVGGNVLINCGFRQSYSKPEFEVTRRGNVFTYPSNKLPGEVVAPTDGHNTPIPRTLVEND